MLFKINDFLYDSEKNVLYRPQSDVSPALKFDTKDSCEDYKRRQSFLKHGIKNITNFKNRGICEAGISLTFNCCLRCNYCSQASIDGIPDTLTIEDIEIFARDIVKKRLIYSIANNSPEVLKIYITGGGEPTYNWNLFKDAVLTLEKVCFENNVELEISMTTNGILNPEQRDFVAEHIKFILVSFDGMDTIQNQNRQFKNGEMTSSIVEESIRSFIKAGSRVTIRSTVWQTDFPCLMEMAKYIEANFPGLYAWEINPVASAGRAVEIWKAKSKELSQNDFVDQYLQVRDYVENLKCGLNVFTPVLSHSIAGFSCGGTGVTANCLWLFPNKKITTCVDSSDIITEVGNICNGKIEYFEKYKDVLLETSIRGFDLCANCIAFPVCGGGCPINRIREETMPTGMFEWECSMQKHYWTFVLKELIKNQKFDNVYLEPFGEEQAEIYQIKWREE